MCRLFDAATLSHLYTPDTSECVTLESNGNWVYEGDGYFVALPDAAGRCATGSVALYQLSDASASPTYRYTAEATVRDAMVAQGWLPTPGDGPFACVPPLRASRAAAPRIVRPVASQSRLTMDP